MQLLLDFWLLFFTSDTYFIFFCLLCHRNEGDVKRKKKEINCLEATSILALAATVSPVSPILVPRNGHFFAPVTDKFDVAADVMGHYSLESAFAQQRVDRLNTIPSWSGSNILCQYVEGQVNVLDYLAQWQLQAGKWQCDGSHDRNGIRFGFRACQLPSPCDLRPLRIGSKWTRKRGVSTVRRQ